jgi:hypothetical protein
MAPEGFFLLSSLLKSRLVVIRNALLGRPKYSLSSLVEWFGIGTGTVSFLTGVVTDAEIEEAMKSLTVQISVRRFAADE